MARFRGGLLTAATAATAAAAAMAAGTLVASAAHAEAPPAGKTQAVVEILVHGLDRVKDSALVITDCESDREGVRHNYLAYTTWSRDGSIRCRFPRPGKVYLIPKTDLKALAEIAVRDAGYADERARTDKLLEKTPLCGRMFENALVDNGSPTRYARYDFEKTATGCSLVKVSSAPPMMAAPLESAAPLANSPSAAPAVSAAPAASAAPMPSNAPTPSAAPTPSPPKSGCTMSATQPRPSAWIASGVVIAFALGLRVRRRA